MNFKGIKVLAIAAILVLVGGGCASLKNTNETPKDGAMMGETQEGNMVGKGENNEGGEKMEGAMMEDTGLEIVAGEYALNEEMSELKWKGSMGNIKSHNGTINIQSASVVLDENQFTLGEFVIDMNSMLEDPNDTGVIKHLMTDDFFNVEKYPTAEFAFTNLEKREDGMYDVTGNLTIRGITNEIKFPAKIYNVENGYKAEAKFTIDRSLWDVKYGSDKFFDNLADKAIDNEIEFDLVWVVEKK